MTFLHTALLTAGLAAVSIPILIHLLMRRRRKPVEWGAMRFLLEAYRRTRRRLLIQRWLLLLTRCAIIAVLAVAIARPILGMSGASAAGGRTLYLLLDNSLAAAATDSGGAAALERHKAAAVSLIDSLGDTDRVALVLLGGPAEGAIVPAASDRAAVKARVADVRTADSAADLPGALLKVATAINDERGAGGAAGVVAPGRVFVAVMSDFLTGSATLDQPLPRLPSGVRLIASAPSATHPPPAGNVGVARVTALRQVIVPTDAGQAQTVSVALVRSGRGVQDAQSVRIRVKRDDTASPVAPSAAASEATTVVRFSPGQREASATIAIDPAMLGTAVPAVLTAVIDADPISGDNLFRLPLATKDSLRVGIVADAAGRGSLTAQADRLTSAQWLAMGLRPTDGAGVDVVDVDALTLDASRLAGLDAVFVTTPHRLSNDAWNRLRGYASAGGVLVVLPPAESALHTWTDAMVTALKIDATFPREPRVFSPDSATRPRLSAATGPGAGGTGTGVTAGSDLADLLAPIRGELDELVRPVNVWKLLAPAPVVSATAAPDPGSGAILRLDDGTPLLSVWTITAADATPAGGVGGGRGTLIYWSVPMDIAWTDLPAKPLFVPLLHELVRQGVGRSRPAMWALAGTNPPPAAPAQATEFRSLGAEPVSIPVNEMGRAASPIRHASLLAALDSRGGVRGHLAINADAAGGRVDVQATALVEPWLSAALPETPPPALLWLGGTADGATGVGGVTAKPAGELFAAAQAHLPMGPTPFAIVAALALFELILARAASAGSLAPGGPAGGRGASGA